jgi:hypothetical protein
MPIVAALAVGGCAWQAADAGDAVKTSVVEEPRPKKPERAAAVQSKEKVAAKESVGYRAAAQQTTAPQDETSCTSVDRCASVLKAMVGGPDRSWIGRPASPTVLANGVRLFAYRALKPNLSCGELAAALAEVETAAQTLSGPVDGLKPDQVTRTRVLSVEVGEELQTENTRRCSARATVGQAG